MKNIYLKRLLKFTALILPIVLIVLFLQQYVFVINDHNTDRIRKFYYEEKDSLDVVFLGASEVFTGYSPGYAYGKYGYTSYMYAMDANVGALYKAQLKEVLSCQTPELILVEVYGFTKTDEEQHNEATLRNFTDNIPNSFNKFSTIVNSNHNNKISCLFPFIKYHGDNEVLNKQLNYVQLNRKSIFSPSLNTGMMTQATIYSGPGNQDAINDTNGHLYREGKAHLVDFLKYCRQENLDNVVFLNFPRYLEHEDNHALLARMSDIQQIVTEYGFDFLDLQKEFGTIGLEAPTDFYNTHHMNIFGQQKLTDYLGYLLINQYHLTPRAQSPENQVHWLKCATFADEYFAVIADLIARGQNYYFFHDAEMFYYAGPSAVERIEAIGNQRSSE